MPFFIFHNSTNINIFVGRFFKTPIRSHFSICYIPILFPRVAMPGSFYKICVDNGTAFHTVPLLLNVLQKTVKNIINRLSLNQLLLNFPDSCIIRHLRPNVKPK